jgi:diguanylate cyclase (GGDEF)-like protein
MSELIDCLADLTGHRERDLLDATLVSALKDMVRPLSVAIYRPVGDAGDQAWFTRARVEAGQSTPTADPPWADVAELPPLDSHPLRYACLQYQAPTFDAGPPASSLFPLATEREVVGVLELITPKPLDETQSRLVISILRFYRNLQGLLDYSERDTLTGLLNRKTFDDAFHRNVYVAQAPLGTAAQDPRRGAAGSGRTWLGVIDIDHFKAVNDNHGHLIGDEVLLLLARLMRSSFRFSDQLFRFGGEEFLVMMRCADAASAGLAFERLRRNVEAFAFPRVGHITVSVGYTVVRDNDTPAAAFERADRAVYHAKSHGRNQVAHHADLVQQGHLTDTERSGDVELF